jgi:phage tail sheath gpL-like
LTASAGLPSTVSGVPSTGMQFSYTYDSAERLRTVTSNVPQSQNYPSTLFVANSTPSYGPMGLMNAQYGLNSSTNISALTLSRTYDNRGRVLSETDEVTAQATGSTGTITISGAEQSGTPGAGTISITSMPPGPESGNFTITIGGISRPVYWSESPSGMSASTLAGMIASAFSGNSLVSVTAVGSGVNITSYLVGTASNYSVSVTQNLTQGTTKIGFSAPSALSGGSNSGGTYDAGTASITIDTNTATVSWGKGSTPSSIASALASAITTADTGFINVQLSGNVISLSSAGKGVGTDWTIDTGIIFDSQNFASSSFSMAISGMSGGGEQLFTPTRFPPTLATTVREMLRL